MPDPDPDLPDETPASSTPAKSEPQENLESPSNEELLLSLLSLSRVVEGTPQLFMFSVHTSKTDWELAGSFTVDGQLSSGEICCVSGEIDNFDLSDVTSFGISVDLGQLDLVATFSQGAKGTAMAPVTTCTEGLPDMTEEAIVELEQDWQTSLLARLALLQSELGPLQLETGIQTGIFATALTVREGRSNSITFAIDETAYSYGTTYGAFFGLSCNVGPLDVRLAVDFSMPLLGNGAMPEGSRTLSFGIGLPF